MSKYIDFNKIIRIDDGYNNNNNTRKKKEGRRAGVEGGMREKERLGDKCL